MSNVSDLTTEILIQIRDGISLLRVDLTGRLDETNARLDETNARLDETNARINKLREETRQGLADVKSAFSDLDHVVLRQDESQGRLAARVDALEGRVNDLEKKAG